jgi:DNA-binding MarR family transcriptional regulator
MIGRRVACGCRPAREKSDGVMIEDSSEAGIPTSPRASLPPEQPGAGLADTIGRLRRALRRGARAADPGNELSVAQLELLASLAEHPGVRPGQLAALLRVRANTVTTLVNALVARELIVRGPAGEDRRVVALTVTEKGLRAVTAWQATNGAVLNLALSALTAAQRRALSRAVPALDALAAAIDRLADDDRPSLDRPAPDGRTGGAGDAKDSRWSGGPS